MFFIISTIIVVPLGEVFATPYDTLVKVLAAKLQQDWPIRSTALGITGSMNNTMFAMMNQMPKDVIIKANSSQVIPVGKESEIALLVLDKKTQKPLTGAQVIIGIERGAPMTTMSMMGGSMFGALEQQNDTSGLYIAKITPDSKGFYTMHTHVVRAGKSMDSMMDNHLDIGIVAK